MIAKLAIVMPTMYGILVNYQTSFGYKLNSHSRVTDQSSRSQWITERNTTSARLSVRLKKTRVRVFFDSSFPVHIVAKWYTR